MRKVILSKQCKKKFKTSLLILLVLPLQACGLQITHGKNIYIVTFQVSEHSTEMLLCY